MKRPQSHQAVLLLCSIAACGLSGADTAESAAISPAQPTPASEPLKFILDKIEEEQIYLRRLANIRLAVEKELAIVRLIRECGSFDAVCTGQGLALKTQPQAELKPALEPEIRPQPASVQSDAMMPAPVESGAPEPAMPAAIKPPLPLQVYRDRALVEYLGQRYIVGVGDSVGSFQVSAIALDYLDFRSSDSRLRIPLSDLRPLDESENDN